MAEAAPAIALVSAPWPLFNRPSIQLGTLKAHLAAVLPDVRTDALHAYLSVAVSRGCWWRRPRPDRTERGCRFCNLNLQWRGYRAKSPERTIREVDTLNRRHRVLSVAFTDNLMPARGAGALFAGLARLPQELRLFGEVRATTPLESLRTMAAAGMEEVQVGIESLSTRLLRKIGKGTTALRNLDLARFPGQAEERLRAFLGRRVEKRLMAREGDRCLSLAAPSGGRRGLGGPP